MKKLLPLVLFISYAFCEAQINVPQPTQVGFQIGYGPTTVLNFQENSEGTFEGGNTFQVGIVIRKRLSSRFSVVLNPLYQSGNYSFTFDYKPFGFITGPSMVYPLKVESQTIAVPMLARWDFGRRVTFFVQTGVQIDFVFEKKHTQDLRFTLGGLPPEDPNLGRIITYEEVKGASKAELSAVLGLGLFIPISKNAAISIETRGTYKTSPIELIYDSLGSMYEANPLGITFLLGIITEL